MVAFAVLGGQDPGIADAHPFIASGHTAPPFPLVISFINSLGQQVSQTSLIDALLQSEALQAIFTHNKQFYPVVYGRNVGIYLSWEAALQQVNGRQIRKFKKTKTFIEAIEFMLTKGNVSTPALPTFLPPHAATSHVTPSRSNIHASSRTTTSSVPGSHKQKWGVTDTADALSMLSLDVEYAHQPPISQPTQPKQLEDYPPCGLLGLAAEKYLDAHGYKGSAIFHILLGFKEVYSPLDFVNYICLRGIPQAEAVYIYELISGSNIGCADYEAVY
ncbi:uncharacterized protein EDB93DRAFT_1245853 [Suillus bovinus]|uniref:uncharacterized protein n=1 Tax=Suillus bovinus TaxID=48563 RepID=UPI001B8770FA|nr:uncharacterized protein EDB93DRAFT_1245853 [Suillus bovinus]KAG2158624.1 hypothetical protein EDB93DRAFT_1245853 [Suillus bovinus]